jgi:hypothetical protein
MSIRKAVLAAITAFTVRDEDRTMCINCHVSVKPGEQITHAHDCCFGPLQAALDQVDALIEGADISHCEACGAGCRGENSHYSEGCSFCDACWKDMMAAIARCDHDLKPYDSEAYDDGLGCDKCGGVFPKDYVKDAHAAPEAVQ